MDVASTADDEISLFCTWALTVTHVACNFMEENFNAEKTGGDPVIPSLNLDTDLVMACDRLVDRLIKAYKNPIQMPIDIARYSKLISPKDTGHNEEREARLLERCPLGHEGTKMIDIPVTILDASGAIIAWYLPDALTKTTQNQSDLEVSASLKGPSSENILKAIARPAATATAALKVMHPQQYWTGLQAFASLGDKAGSKELLKMSETLQYWAMRGELFECLDEYAKPSAGVQEGLSDMGFMQWKGIELAGHDIRHSILEIWELGLDIGEYLIVMFYTFHRLPTTEYWVSGVGTRYVRILNSDVLHISPTTNY
ncbi:hypothetical protein BDR03DRAFT_983717 [Suillus americanus]|nr:hypothetical protein BDR03DRAFT_983717 [Suillus americanus]